MSNASYLRRRAAATYLRENRGIPSSEKTLAKLACIGGGRVYRPPDHITKNGLPHTFPVGTMAAKILKDIPRREKCELLFPTRWADDRPMSGWSKYKAEMTDGVRGWTLHDLRRTFGTKHAELKVAPHVVERLLNHKFGSITNHTDGMVSAVALVYNRYQYLPEMREAIELWEKHLALLFFQDKVLTKAA